MSTHVFLHIFLLCFNYSAIANKAIPLFYHVYTNYFLTQKHNNYISLRVCCQPRCVWSMWPSSPEWNVFLSSVLTVCIPDTHVEIWWNLRQENSAHSLERTPESLYSSVHVRKHHNSPVFSNTQLRYSLYSILCAGAYGRFTSWPDWLSELLRGPQRLNAAKIHHVTFILSECAKRLTNCKGPVSHPYRDGAEMNSAGLWWDFAAEGRAMARWCRIILSTLQSLCLLISFFHSKQRYGAKYLQRNWLHIWGFSSKVCHYKEHCKLHLPRI